MLGVASGCFISFVISGVRSLFKLEATTLIKAIVEQYQVDRTENFECSRVFFLGFVQSSRYFLQRIDLFIFIVFFPADGQYFESDLQQ